MRENYKNVFGAMAFIVLLFSSVCSSAQQRTITGRIVDGSDNSTLPGVSIKVKDSPKTTSADKNGNYEISVADNDVLVFSYIGFLIQELPVAGKAVLNVVLQPSSQDMQEVVVVGYGTQKKSDVSGAVATVNMERATAIPTTNVAEMLRGQAAGVQVTLGSARPGGTSNIQIRGRNSIRGGNDPLIVLDGFPIENINDVNPDDISSMEVLKDASAQAIYGARASNGVILITTKKGTAGKVKIGLSSYLTTQKLTKNFDLYNAEEFAQFRREARRTNNADGSYSTDEVNFGGSAQAPEYINFKAGNYVNWEDEVLRDALISSNTVSLTGGTDKTKIFTSATYFNQSGLIPSSAYKRGSFRFNVDQKINDKASIEANINIATDKQRRESANLDFITISPFTGPYDLDGNLVRNVAGANASSSTINPLWNIRESDNEIKTNFYNLNLVGNYKFTENFSYKLNTLFSRKFLDEGRYVSRVHSAGVTPNGSANLANALREEFLIENILNYNAQINDIHKLDFTFVQSVNQRNTSRTEMTATGFGNDLLGFDGITNALNFKTTRAEEQYRLSSFLGRARYNLMDKYLLTLTARRDGASVFAENKKWGFFPAASVAWQLHREGFLKNVKAIDQLKFRASYGAVGNQSLSPFTTLGVVDPNPYVFGGVIVGGNLPGSVLPNPNLTWETSTTFNAGLDFGLFNNRLTGSAEYYHTNTTDLLADISLGGTSGFSSTITNGAASRNKGFEVLLSGQLIRNDRVNWSLTGTLSRNFNEIVKTGITDITGKAKDDLGRNRYVGKPINVIRTLVFDGIFQTDAEALASAQGTLGGTVTPFQNVSTLYAGAIRLKDVNGDGVINDQDHVLIGTDPKWFGSIATNLEYKGFELLADLYVVEGATRYNPYLASFNEGGTFQSVRNGIKVDYWTPERPSTQYPRPNYNNAPANMPSLGIADASYIRLRTLSLGYNLPAPFVNKAGLSHVKFYVTATNLFTITDYKSYSPENNPNDFPDTKAFTLGLNIGF